MTPATAQETAAALREASAAGRRVRVHGGVALAHGPAVARGHHAPDRRAVARAGGRVEREHLACFGEDGLGAGERDAGLDDGGQVGHVVLDDRVEALGRQLGVGGRL